MKVTSSSIQQLDKLRPDGRPLPKSECRRWRLWATAGGERRSRRFRGTWTQARKALSEFVSELEAFVPNSDTFEAYAESWHRWRRESGDYSPNTISGERTALNSIMRTELAGMRMDEVDAPACRDALLWLKSNKLKGGEYAPASLGKVHQVLFAVMAQAEADGKVARNPMASVQRPRARSAERDALSPEELQLFLNRVDSLPTDGRTVALYLMACLGLRCGEACALQDAEVDGGMVRVTSTVRGADNTVGPTKSAAGNRLLPMPGRLAAKIGEWRELRDALGLHDARWLCCRTDGTRMSTSSMENWWRDTARGKLGCDGMVLHQLRHSNLSMMARHMSVFDLQRYAGWSSIAPAKVYVHADLDAVVRAVELAWI